MEKILIFFIYQNPFIAKVFFETSSYFTVKSLYPFSGVEFDYFNDNLNFFNEESYSTLKACIFTNLLLYHSLNRYHYQKRLNKFPEIPNEDDIIQERMRSVLLGLDINFVSKLSLENLGKTIFQYRRNKTLSFDSLEEDSTEEEELEIMAEIVLNEGVNDIMFFNYQDAEYTGLICNKSLNLHDDPFKNERMIQELFIWKYSAPRLGVSNQNPFLNEYFTNRFLEFDETKKANLFLHFSVDKSLFLYNKILSNWLFTR